MCLIFLSCQRQEEKEWFFFPYLMNILRFLKGRFGKCLLWSKLRKQLFVSEVVLKFYLAFFGFAFLSVDISVFIQIGLKTNLPIWICTSPHLHGRWWEKKALFFKLEFKQHFKILVSVGVLFVVVWVFFSHSFHQ